MSLYPAERAVAPGPRLRLRRHGGGGGRSRVLAAPAGGQRARGEDEKPREREVMRTDRAAQYRAIGQRIAYYRQKRGLSREQLAEMARCSPQDIRQVEGDDGHWSRSQKRLVFLCSVAEALAVDLPVFFLPMSEEIFNKFRTDK